MPTTSITFQSSNCIAAWPSKRSDFPTHFQLAYWWSPHAFPTDLKENGWRFYSTSLPILQSDTEPKMCLTTLGVSKNQLWAETCQIMRSDKNQHKRQKFWTEFDKRKLMASVGKLKGTKIFVKPKLLWRERILEKSLLNLRYHLIQNGFDKQLFRKLDLKLFYNAQKIDSSKPIQEIINFLSTLSQSDQWLCSIPIKCSLSNVQGLTSINKQASLLDFALVKSVDILFITETWLNNHVDNRILSLFGQYEVISRCDRITGPHGGVAFLAKQNIFSQIHVLSLPLSYDFVSSIVWLQPRNLAILFILVYLPPFSSP